MSSTQTAITIAASTSIATALLIYLLLRTKRSDVREDSDLRRSDDGRKIQEDSLNRRRAAVLGKFIFQIRFQICFELYRITLTSIILYTLF